MFSTLILGDGWTSKENTVCTCFALGSRSGRSWVLVGRVEIDARHCPVARRTATNSGRLSSINEAQSAIVDDHDIVRKDVFEESEEAREIPHTAPKRGKQPTGREIEEHNRTHIPFRSWCKFCVSARAPNFPHRARNPDQSVIKNEIAADLFSQGCQWRTKPASVCGP